MKPLKLTMNAFGSYADLQTIDFTALGTNGLYLITGETGSGKTTIFDAISFALFGRASGSSRGDYSMLRSDFADNKDKTFVKLNFVSGNATYGIERSIKKTGQDVALLLPDGTTVSGDRNVKSKIGEIVGLDREQFAQIVMIAQNDFLRFLQSGTDDRLKILRRIFGTETLKNFQEQLKTRAKQEKEKRDLIVHDFNRYDVDVYKRDEQFAEWETQIKTDRTNLAEVDKGIAQYDKVKQDLAAKLAIAENLSGKFSDLASTRVLQEKHESRANEIETCKKRAALGETALRKVKPLADEATRTEASHANAQANLVVAKKQEVDALRELEQAEDSVKKLPPLAEAQVAFATLSKKWETVTEQLKKLTVLQKNHDEVTNRQTVLSSTQEELAAVCKVLGELPSIDDKQIILEQLTQELTGNEDAYAKLCALQADLGIINEKQNALSKMQSEFEALNIGFANADDKYRSLEDAFFRSQAGILAGGLTDGKPCPVCGSTVHPNPATLSDGKVTEAELRKTKDARDTAQNKREKKSLECGNAKTEIDTMSSRFVADLAVHIPEPTLATAGTQLVEITDTVKTKGAELTKKKTVTEKSFAELKTKFQNATNKHNELSPKATSLQSEIDTLVRRFTNDFSEFVPNTEWETSKTELAQLLDKTRKQAESLTADKQTTEQSLADLTANWETASKRKAAAESAHKSSQTLVVERGTNEQEASRLCVDAQAKYEEALRTYGFPGKTEYTAALITENELAEMSKLLTDYEKDGEQFARDIKRLENETAGKERPDLENLKLEAEAANVESSALGKRREEIMSQLDRTETKLKELRQAAIDFEKADKSYAAVKQLSDTASGKLDFETYAQMAYFERVLMAANQRLKVMSQNRYTLLRKSESSDGRLKTGLEIEAFDAYTGKARSANSLSGGESFMASLSLALGLSDVVQQSAGGICLDAMFIDEGFGTLDTETLDIAIKTLSEMAGTDRIIGIISHVTELRERVDRQIQIEKTTSGSRITMLV